MSTTHTMAMDHPTTMPRTFADLVVARTGRPLPAAAPTATQHRKNQAALNDEEKQRFVDALDSLNLPDQTGVSAYGRLVAIHADMGHHMHNMGDGSPMSALGQQRFLPWHRVYLYEFELLLQTIDSQITIPYWDWTNQREQTVPAWLASVRPTVNIPNPGPGVVKVARFPGTAGYTLAAVLAGNVNGAPSLAEVQRATDYTTFASGLESIHDLVHVWFGRRGTMYALDRAPADPIFWMHHANIDRLWWEWHASVRGQDTEPNLQGRDAIMDPWRFTETDTRDIAHFNYDYAR